MGKRYHYLNKQTPPQKNENRGLRPNLTKSSCFKPDGMPLFCLQRHEFRGRTSVGRNYGDINPIFVNPLHVILYSAYRTQDVRLTPCGRNTCPPRYAHGELWPSKRIHLFGDSLTGLPSALWSAFWAHVVLECEIAAYILSWVLNV